MTDSSFNLYVKLASCMNARREMRASRSYRPSCRYDFVTSNARAIIRELKQRNAV